MSLPHQTRSIPWLAIGVLWNEILTTLFGWPARTDQRRSALVSAGWFTGAVIYAGESRLRWCKPFVFGAVPGRVSLYDGSEARTKLSLMVTRLDRLARSTRGLLNTLAAITGKETGFRFLRRMGRHHRGHGWLMLTILGGLAEFERELIRARTSEGRARAKANRET